MRNKGWKKGSSWKKAFMAAVAGAFLWGAPALAAGPAPQLDATALDKQMGDALKALAKSGNLSGMAKAYADLIKELEGKKEWTKELMDAVVRIADQAGVAADQLVQSVAGCVKEDGNGKPVIGIPVFSIQMLDTMLSGGLHSPQGVSLTKMTDDAPFLFVSVLNGIPAGLPFAVPEALLSGEQKSLGAGCYWVPVQPGALRAWDLASGGYDKSMSIAVQPFAPGYIMDPAAKSVFYNHELGEIRVTPLRNLLDVSGGDSTAVQAQ